MTAAILQPKRRAVRSDMGIWDRFRNVYFSGGAGVREMLGEDGDND